MVQKRKDEVLEQLRKGIASLMKTNRISVFYGTGTILDREHVKVALSGDCLLYTSVGCAFADNFISSEDGFGRDCP